MRTKNQSVKTNSSRSKGGAPFFKGHGKKTQINQHKGKIMRPKTKSSLDKVLISTQSLKPKRKPNKKRLVSDERVFKEVTIKNNTSPPMEQLTNKEAKRL
jgi:hypothetical protein